MKKKFVGIIMTFVIIVGLIPTIALSASGSDIAARATYYDGVSRSTYDCSAYTQKVYADCGISIPRMSQDQSTCGTRIYSNNLSDLKAGDIICFGSSSDANSITHVGIYDGNGGVWHSSYTYWKIRKDSLSDWMNSSEYTPPYQFAVRVISDDTNPPSNASISIDKESVRIGETFKITCSSDTYSQYYLAIFDADSGEKIIAENVSNGVFQNSFLKAGKYNAYMTAYNSQGSVDSNWITFFVFGSPPTKAALSVDKTELNTNDAVTLKSSSDAYYVRIYTSIFKNDNLVYSGEIPYDFIYNVSSNGIYTAHITAYTHEGGVDSNWVTFYVGKYNVSYNANGGNGAPSAQTKIHGKNLTISNSVPTRNGYTFKGWNTNANGTGTSYSSGETYNINSNITLYAQWSLNATTPTTSITATRTTSSVIEVQTTITNLTQSAQCITAVYSNNGTLLEQVINNVNSTTGSITAYFSSDSNASYVKVFLWDSLKGMKPLTNSEKVNI